MSGHPKKPKTLSHAEIERFVETATQLHTACCDPRIAPAGDHYRALMEVKMAVRKGILDITGKEADWIRRSSS